MRTGNACEVVLAFSLFAFPLAGSDRPQWRGPNGNGLVTGGPELIDTLPAAGPTKLWHNRELPNAKGGGWGSVSVADGRAYLFLNWKRKDPLSGQRSTSDVVACLDAKTGKALWRTEFPGRAHGHSCSSTPCIADGRVLVLGSNANLYGLGAKSGDTLWQLKSKGRSGNNDSSSIVIVDGTAILLSGMLTGLDPKTAETLWTQRRLSGAHNSVVCWRFGGRSFVLCNTEMELGCVDPETGELLWTVLGGGWSTAAIDGDTMAVFSDRHEAGLSAFKLTEKSPEKLWSYPLTDRGASPVVDRSHVYAIGGKSRARAVCINVATGKPKWDEPIQGTEISSPIVADGKLIAVVGTTLRMIGATPQRYTHLGTANLNVEPCTSPALVDGTLYLRRKDGIACYDLRKASGRP